jgi:antibiotic biosynthesis monooxygenase
MYARLVRFDLQPGKESVATDLARDLVPQIRQHPGCQAVTVFGEAGNGPFNLYVLWSSQEEADAAATVIGPQLAQHLQGNTVSPYDAHLYPVIQSA